MLGKEELPCRKPLCRPECEHLHIKLSSKKDFVVYILIIFRPPSGKVIHFVEGLESFFMTCSEKKNI